MYEGGAVSSTGLFEALTLEAAPDLLVPVQRTGAQRNWLHGFGHVTCTTWPPDGPN